VTPLAPGPAARRLPPFALTQYALCRFGVSEFQDLVRNDKLLAHSQQDAPASLTHDLESLRDDMLGLQIYTITWADARKAPIAEPVGIN